MEIIHPCAKLLRHPCATTLEACARSIFQTELAGPCAKMNSWDLVHVCLRDAGAKLTLDLGFLVSIGLFKTVSFSARSVVFRLLRLSSGFSTSRRSVQFLFCQQSSTWVPPVKTEVQSGFAYCPALKEHSRQYMVIYDHLATGFCGE